MGFIATAPLVVVHDDQGRQHYVYGGSPLPEFVSAERAKELAEEGYVADLTEKVAGDVVPTSDGGIPAEQEAVSKASARRRS